MSLGDILNKVQVTNGGGPKFTIPMGIVVLALAAAHVYTQTQIWTTQHQLVENATNIKNLISRQVHDTDRIREVENAVIELRTLNRHAAQKEREE